MILGQQGRLKTYTYLPSLPKSHFIGNRISKTVFYYMKVEQTKGLIKYLEDSKWTEACQQTEQAVEIHCTVLTEEVKRRQSRFEHGNVMNY